MIFLHYLQFQFDSQKNAIPSTESFGLNQGDFAILATKDIEPHQLKQLDIDDVIIVFQKDSGSTLFLAALTVKFFFENQNSLERWIQSKDLSLVHETPQPDGLVLLDRIYANSIHPPRLNSQQLMRIFNSEAPRTISHAQADQLLKLAGQPPLQETLDSFKI
jgi:hypothetical protein